jgi:hypothetical protein
MAVSRPTRRLGTGVEPWATVAAASAIPKVETTTLPWPNPSSVRWTSSSAGGTEPESVGKPTTS